MLIMKKSCIKSANPEMQVVAEVYKIVVISKSKKTVCKVHASLVCLKTNLHYGVKHSWVQMWKVKNSWITLVSYSHNRSIHFLVALKHSRFNAMQPSNLFRAHVLCWKLWCSLRFFNSSSNNATKQSEGTGKLGT